MTATGEVVDTERVMKNIGPSVNLVESMKQKQLSNLIIHPPRMLS
jgi:hypothetical protein